MGSSENKIIKKVKKKMDNLLKTFFVTAALIGLLVTIGAAFVLALAQDWGSFTACYIGMAISALGGLGFKALDQRTA